MVNDEPIKNLNEFLEQVNRLNNMEKDKEVFFRGISTEEHSLKEGGVDKNKPKIYRDSYIEHRKGEETNGEVILYQMKRGDIKYNDSDMVSILSNLAFMPGDFNLNIDGGENLEENGNYKKLIHQICSEKNILKVT